MNPKVDLYFSELQKFEKEMSFLRLLVLDCGLTEELKWGEPCYTFQNSNIVLIHAFKDYCALLFMKGALLHDSEGILIQQTVNVQSGRQIRFTNLKEISDLKTTIKAYIFEAIEVEKAGLKVAFKTLDDFTIPEEFQIRLDNNLELKNAFEALTLGRQKGYIFHFSEAKQPKTREARIDKFIPRILMGKGFSDCVCGLSKRMPNCDGSHKQLNDNN